MFHDVSKVVFCSKRNTFATFSEDALHFLWQAQHFGDLWQAQHFRRVVLRFFCESHCQRCATWWKGARSGDNVQIPRQAWHFVTCDENRRMPRTKRRFWGRFVTKLVGKRRFWSCEVWNVRKARTKCSFLMLQHVSSRAPLYTLHSTFHTPHFTLYTPHSTLYTFHSTLHTLHPTLHTPHFTLYTPHFTLHFTLHTFHFTLYTLHFTLHTPHFTLHTLNFTLCTPHFTLYTPHFTLSFSSLITMIPGFVIICVSIRVRGLHLVWNSKPPNQTGHVHNMFSPESRWDQR